MHHADFRPSFVTNCITGFRTFFLMVLTATPMVGRPGLAFGQESHSKKEVFQVNQKTTILKAETSFNTDNGEFFNNLVGFGQDFDGSLFKDQNEFPWKLSYRLWANQNSQKRFRSIEEKILEKLIAHISTSWSTSRITVGYQELTWGENLVMPILDVVNPRSMIHPYGYYDPAAKIPQFLWVVEWPFDSFKLDLIANPFPTSMQHPDQVVGFNVKEPESRPRGLKSAEYGTRITVVTDALETKLYAYRHGSRIPAYTFLPYSSGDSAAPDVQADERLSNTLGLSSSYASYQLLFRGDLAVHQDNPATNIGTEVESSTTRQWILGLSTITMDQQSFGFELHGETWDQAPLVYNTNALVDADPKSAAFYWAALLANLNFFKSRVQPNLVYFHGLNSSDSLMRINTSLAVDDNSTVVVELLRTNTKTSSPKMLLSQRDTLSLRWSLVF